jgi:tetratricopeptide (TPR) repeat protein
MKRTITLAAIICAVLVSLPALGLVAASAADEKLAAKKYRMAGMYLANASARATFKDKARVILEEIVVTWPDSKAAEKAAAQLKALGFEVPKPPAKRPGGSKTSKPPVEAKPKPTPPAVTIPATRPPVKRGPRPTTPLPKPRRGPGIKKIVFAAPFENASGKDQYDPTAAGMGDLVAVLLAQQEGISAVERQQLMALTGEQARALLGLTGAEYAVKAGKMLWADTVLVGRVFLVKEKLLVSVKAVDIATEQVIASDQIACRPTDLMEASLQVAIRLGKQMKLPLPKIDLKMIEKAPIASLHFSKGLSNFYAGNMDAAIMQFMQTLDLDPDFIEAHDWSGLSYFRLNEYAHAVIEWDKYLKRAPESKHTLEVRAKFAEAKAKEKIEGVKRIVPATKKTEK